MTKLYITVEGGVVQCVSSDDPAALAGIDVTIIDYDISGCDPDEMDMVRMKDGSESPAFADKRSVQQAEIESVDPAVAPRAILEDRQ